MLLRYSLNEEKAAVCIEEAVENVLKDGYRTADLYRDGFKKVTTEEMAARIAERI